MYLNKTAIKKKSPLGLQHCSSEPNPEGRQAKQPEQEHPVHVVTHKRQSVTREGRKLYLTPRTINSMGQTPRLCYFFVVHSEFTQLPEVTLGS